MRTSGNRDESIDKALKAYISQGNMCVSYLVPDGYTLTQSSNWQSPLEGINAGAQASTISAIGQVETGYTTISQLTSAIAWNGNMPLNISFQGKLSAQNKLTIHEEVLKGVSETYQMMSAEIAKNAGLSKIPQPITLTIFETLVFTNCQITENSTRLPMMAHAESKLPIKAEVDLTFTTKAKLNSSEFAKLFRKS